MRLMALSSALMLSAASVALADELRDDDLPGRGDAHADHGVEHDDLAARRHGRERLLTAEPADDERVDHRIERLQAVCQQKRERKADKLPHDMTLGHVADHGGFPHGRPLSLDGFTIRIPHVRPIAKHFIMRILHGANARA